MDFRLLSDKSKSVNFPFRRDSILAAFSGFSAFRETSAFWKIFFPSKL
ncbi:MAG TPA: hypothetical protein PK079_11280 [Leptospiraceae bacterium]|nr:hypothetical protein [Leptospiraceae bacterium]HNE53746.1 hypothetical protein [Leptospiraceae bacterium]HNH54862.1 hypothetical protein [Leptospiraceae bacterium]HNL75401.1 hypothetical protein [Leptospiraceae bacterium]HNN78495.1 hypothetical protein [Leptospiraceae bacterium]